MKRAAITFDKVLRSRYFQLVCAALISLCGVYMLLLPSVFAHLDAAVDFMLAGFNIAGYFYGGLIDRQHELIDELFNLFPDPPMTKTDQGYVSPYQIDKRRSE